MEEKKPDMSEYTNEVLIADCLLRLACIETILVTKGVCSKDELRAMSKLLSEQVTRRILSKAGISDNLKEFIASLQGDKN